MKVARAHAGSVLTATATAFYTVPHFDGYPAVPIQLKAATKRALHEGIVDGWLACAPHKLTHEYVRRNEGHRH